MAIGNQHQQFPRNQTYIVASSGGEPRRLASTFFSADEPLWSPDGQHVLFLGAEDDKKPVAERYDWWVVPINGEPPVATGALAALRTKGVSPVWREPADWIDDSIVFAASTGQYATVQSTGLINQSSIWRVRLASDSWRVNGEPQQLTIASGAEAQPSVARGSDGIGRLALTNSDWMPLPNARRASLSSSNIFMRRGEVLILILSRASSCRWVQTSWCSQTGSAPATSGWQNSKPAERTRLVRLFPPFAQNASFGFRVERHVECHRAEKI